MGKKKEMDFRSDKVSISRHSSRHSPSLRSTLLALLSACSLNGETHSLTLNKGVNLVSIPLNLANPSPSSVFAQLGNNFIEVASYDNQTKSWTYYRNPNLPQASTSNIFPTLAMASISPGNGYLIRVADAATMTVSGTPPEFPSVTLYPGLNFVGFPLATDSPSVVGMEDLLNGPDFRFENALEYTAGVYQPFTNNSVNDDKFTLFNPQKAFWVESTSSTPQVWTPQVSQPPLVYFGSGQTIVVEAPIPEDSAPATTNLAVNITRPFAGEIGFIASGTAHPNTDFSISSTATPITPSNSIGEVSVASGATSFSIPVSIRQKNKLQTNSSVFVTLRRPVETPTVQDSGTLPQVAHIKITDGKNGIYDGFLRGESGSSLLSGQKFRIALRSNGIAIFDPDEGGMISSRFSLPYTLSGGIPQFSGTSTFALNSMASLKREVEVTISPTASVSLDTEPSATPSFELPVNLTFLNLTASGPFETSAKFTFTLSDPAQ